MKENFISISKVALLIDTSVTTIKRWYKWYEDNKYDHYGLELPEYYHLDARKTKMFKESDVEKLSKFKEALNTTHIGVMAEFNANYQWGVRGKKILERKESNNEQDED